MPVSPTYPGVYIEEIPSGVRTIPGVATSITAFVGRARRGPVNQAWTINSYADFERVFGGLWVDSAMSYAVRDFYLNGGSQAIIVRLFSPNREDIMAAATSQAQTAADAVAASAAAMAAAQAVAQAATAAVAGATDSQDVAIAAANAVGAAVQAAADAAAAAAPVTKARLAADTLNLEAAYEGDWGNHLRARVDHDLKGEPDDVANNFNLSIRDGLTGQVEVFRNLSVDKADPRYVVRVLDNQSRFVRVSGTPPAIRPDPHPNPGPGEDVWSDNTPETNTKVAATDKATDGDLLAQDDFIGTGKEGAKRGLFALEQADLFNLLCIPPCLETGDVDADVITKAATYCEDRRAMLLVDSPSNWTDKKRPRMRISRRTWARSARTQPYSSRA